MRVLHLTRDYPPRRAGGISTAVGGLVGALADAGVESRVVSFDAWRPTTAGKSSPPVNDGDALHVTSVAHHDAIVAFIAAATPDVVHVHDALLWDYAEHARAAKTVFTMHVAHGVLRKLRSLDVATRSESAQARAIAAADVVTIPSAGLAGLIGRPCHVTPFGVTLPADQPDVERAGVLFAGRLTDIKGVNELFAAMERVQLPLTIAGGLIENRKSERRWRRRFEENASASLQARTTWLGWLDEDALGAAYRSAALLAAPSWHETYGFSVLEAMAHGVAVIASDVSGHASLIEHERSGWLVPPRDVDALANALQHLATATPLARELGMAAIDETRARRSWATLCSSWLEAYR